MADYAVDRIESVVERLARGSVLILGVAYRGNVREAAFTSAKLLQDALLEHDATVYVDDPLFSNAELHALGYMPLPAGRTSDITAIILQSGHQTYQAFDFRRFTSCQVVLDGRRELQRAMIESLGMHYIAIGDGKQRRYKGESSDSNESAFVSSAFSREEGV